MSNEGAKIKVNEERIDQDSDCEEDTSEGNIDYTCLVVPK